MAELFVNVKNETKNANNERTKFNPSNLTTYSTYSESVAFIEKSGLSLGDEIWAKDKFYLFVPNDTNSEGKVLTKTNVPENSGNAATINSEGDGRGEWDDYLSFEDRFSYGVEWQVNDLSTVSRIGNPLLHEDLPIQNEYRGCYYDLQNKKVLYWYDPDNWENVIPSNIEGNELYAGKYPAFNGVDMYYTKSGNTFTSTPYTGTAKSGITSKNNLVDYSDSNIANDTAPRYSVMVHTPKFYGKSGWYEKNGVVYNWVRISPMKIAGDWVEIPEMFISAYHATIYNDDPSTDTLLSLNGTAMDNCKAVSVLNLSNNYKGGGYKRYKVDGSAQNSTSIRNLDSNSRNGIPRTGAFLKKINKWCNNWKKDNKVVVENLYYDYYKWIFFWNYIIEYCNFDCLTTFNSLKNKNNVVINGKTYNNLTKGVSLGGLGYGLTGKLSGYSEEHNGIQYVVSTCGDCNYIGNSTNIHSTGKSAIINSNSVNLNKPKWRGFENPFGEISMDLNGIIIKIYKYSEKQISEVYTTVNNDIMNTFLDSENSPDLSNFKFIGYVPNFNFTQTEGSPNKTTFDVKINPGLNGEMIYSSTNEDSAKTKDVYVTGDTNTSPLPRYNKLSTGYRLAGFDTKGRAGIGTFIMCDNVFKVYYTYYGFRFIVKA